MLQRSPVDAAHRAFGAKMGAFAGWDMPISYPAGTLAEHAAVRERVGLFDVSHLGKLMIRGSGARNLLEATLTNRMDDLAVGRARYALVCTPQGGTVDDLIAYALADDEILVVPNASNRDAATSVLRSAATGDVSIEVLAWTTFAIQGPRSKAIIEARHPETKEMPSMSVVRSGPFVIARSGYTGEWGYEVFTTLDDAETAWTDLLDLVRNEEGEACGLAARDTLRLEMGYPLHGNELSTEITPLEAGAAWAVKLDGRDFPGANALRAAPPARTLVGLRASHRIIPRHGCPVRHAGKPVGIVTSGTLSPTLRRPIALALIDRNAAGAAELEVDVRGRVGTFEVCEPPFVDASPRRLPEV